VHNANKDDDDDYNCDTLWGEGSNNLLTGIIIILAFTYNTDSETILCGDDIFHKLDKSNLPLKLGNGDFTICRKRILMDEISHNII
jgi:hypothetical protein